MIEITHVHLETPIVLSCDRISELIVESPAEFYSMVSELKSEFMGGEGRFVFSNGEKMFSPSAAGELVHNIFDVAPDEKKTITALYKKLGSDYAERGSAEAESRLAVAIADFFTELFEGVSVPIEYDEPSVAALLKACAVRPGNDYDSVTEKIICMINLSVALYGTEFFVFVDLKSVLDDDALVALFEHCRREKVALLLVESCARRPLCEFESGIRITDDLCEILA